MKFFIDTANLDQIREANELGVLDGVTTNPSLMAKEGIRGVENQRKHYLEICEIVGGDVSATGNYTENNNWLYHSGELDHRGHYPYDVFFIQPTLYILSIRETTGLVQIPFYIQGLSFPLNLSPKTLFYLTITRTRPV